MVIRAACNVDSLTEIRNRLDSRSDERYNADFHASSINLRNASTAEVLYLALKFRPPECGVTGLYRCGKVEMFFQCNFGLHGWPTRARTLPHSRACWSDGIDCCQRSSAGYGFDYALEKATSRNPALPLDWRHSNFLFRL